MKFGMVNKSTTVNQFVFRTLNRNFTHLAVTRETNLTLDILKGGGGEKSQILFKVGEGKRAKLISRMTTFNQTM